MLTFSYLNKLPDEAKGAWILISCCYGKGKVNEKGAGMKALRVCNHRAFL